MTSYALGARAVVPRSANSRALVPTPRRSIRVLATQDPIDQASEKVEKVWALRFLCDQCRGVLAASSFPCFPWTLGCSSAHFRSKKGDWRTLCYAVCPTLTTALKSVATAGRQQRFCHRPGGIFHCAGSGIHACAA